MEKQQLRELLGELSFSADLPDEILEQIAAVSVVIDYPAGTVLFREGSQNQNLYLICSGSVALEMCVPARGCLRLLSLGPGDMVAWSALLGDGQMTATALVTEDTRVVAASADKLRKICESNHDVGYQLMRRMAEALSRRLLATRLQMLDLFST
jgi:CRP/FNR family transcriptional regulator, cyclic AMP receptor protein